MQKKIYTNGQIKEKGDYLELVDCTSRGSGKVIKFDDHEGCVECVFETTLRKTGYWIYFYNTGNVCIEGNYIVIDFIGVPSLRDGIWTMYRENGIISTQTIYDKGEVQETIFFDGEGFKID